MALAGTGCSARLAPLRLISPSLAAPPLAAAGPWSLPLSHRQLMFMQRPLLQVNCVKGKQVG